MFSAVAFIKEDNVIQAYEAKEEHICLNASLQMELSLVDIKIDTIHIRTTKQDTRPVYNQINGQLIELMERRDMIPIITLLEQISY
ncbi:hypothetical protein HZS_4073, partial [Henneguya salminicola]